MDGGHRPHSAGYQVPVDQLLPRDAGDPRSDGPYLDLTAPAEVDQLMTAAQYETFLSKQKH